MGKSHNLTPPPWGLYLLIALTAAVIVSLAFLPDIGLTKAPAPKKDRKAKEPVEP